MKALLTYGVPVISGVYFYLLFQAIFFIQFEAINPVFGILELAIVAVGSLSILWTLFLRSKLTRKKNIIWIIYVLAVPLGYIGALGGGLIFGLLGLLIAGLLPFIIVVSAGFGLIAFFTRTRAVTSNESATMNHDVSAQAPGTPSNFSDSTDDSQ